LWKVCPSFNDVHPRRPFFSSTTFSTTTPGSNDVSRRRHPHSVPTILASLNGNAAIEFQSDDKKFGRGAFHLSASLNEGDIVVYQTGTWLVDGVEVGDGTPPKFKYARIETIQLVWTHNCEHGVLRGIHVDVVDRDHQQVGEEDDSTTRRQRIVILKPLEEIEFGPEQLIARLPTTWDETLNEGYSTVELHVSLWKAPSW
jgi:hypothetical protein